jgi:hypothetical protein
MRDGDRAFAFLDHEARMVVGLRDGFAARQPEATHPKVPWRTALAKEEGAATENWNGDSSESV